MSYNIDVILTFVSFDDTFGHDQFTLSLLCGFVCTGQWSGKTVVVVKVNKDI